MSALARLDGLRREHEGHCTRQATLCGLPDCMCVEQRAKGCTCGATEHNLRVDEAIAEHRREQLEDALQLAEVVGKRDEANEEIAALLAERDRLAAVVDAVGRAKPENLPREVVDAWWKLPADVREAVRERKP